MPDPAQPEAAAPSAAATPPVVVKKYANRRLYNTESSSYITLDNLAEMIRHGRDFVVYDAKSGEDITRGVLTQIIVEEENKGRSLLPTGFLRQLIGFYGDSLQTMVPRYLEQSMQHFALQQEKVRQTMQKTVGNFFPFGIEEVGRQNLAMMERAMSMFTPFYHSADGAAAAGAEPEAEPDEKSLEIAALRAEVESLRAQLAHPPTGAARPEPAPPARADPPRPHLHGVEPNRAPADQPGPEKQSRKEAAKG